MQPIGTPGTEFYEAQRQLGLLCWKRYTEITRNGSFTALYLVVPLISMAVIKLMYGMQDSST